MMKKMRNALTMATLLVAMSAQAESLPPVPTDTLHDVKSDRGQGLPELDCVIEPSDIVNVGTAAPGIVGDIKVDRSDLVNKGDVLVTIESRVEQATVALAKARSEMSAAIQLREQAAALGKLTEQRNQTLLKKAAISKQEMDQVATETRVAELQVQQEKDNRRIAELEYQRAKAMLQQRTLLSPVTGVVMERFKSVGEYVGDEPIVRVAQLDPLHVEVIVPVDYWGQVKPGMQAAVKDMPTAQAGESKAPHVRVATVERVDKVADTASGTYGVRLSLPNPDYAIAAGMRCRMSFLLPEKEASKPLAEVTQPAAAISRGQNE